MSTVFNNIKTLGYIDITSDNNATHNTSQIVLGYCTYGDASNDSLLIMF